MEILPSIILKIESIILSASIKIFDKYEKPLTY